jgi:hypothetical protein
MPWSAQDTQIRNIFPKTPTLSAPSVVKIDAFLKNAQLRGFYPLTLPSVDSQVANSTGLRVCMKTVLEQSQQ